jgi:hypothetical protein
MRKAKENQKRGREVDSLGPERMELPLVDALK